MPTSTQLGITHPDSAQIRWQGMLALSEGGPNRWTTQRGLGAKDGLLVGQIPTEMGKSKLCLRLNLLSSPEAALPSSTEEEARLLVRGIYCRVLPFSALARNRGPSCIPCKCSTTKLPILYTLSSRAMKSSGLEAAAQQAPGRRAMERLLCSHPHQTHVKMLS